MPRLTSDVWPGGKRSLAVGDTYAITLTGQTKVLADVDQLVEQSGCNGTQIGGLARIRSEGQGPFQIAAEARFNAFLGEPSSSAHLIRGDASSNPIREIHLSPDERSAVEPVLNGRMKQEFRKLEPEHTIYLAYPGGSSEWRSTWQQRDSALLAGKAKLELRVHEIHFGGSLRVMHMIRALWTVDGKPAFFLISFVYPGSTDLQGVDATRSAGMRLPEMLDEHRGFEQLDVPVNLFNGNRLLLFNVGYESFTLELFDFEPRGLKDTKIGYGDGC